MRNLLGRLNARDTGDLTRIATAWKVPPTAPDRAAIIGQLYRAMTDIRAARDLWVALPPDERHILQTLSTGEDNAFTIPDLAARLGQSPEEIRATSARLYQKGIIDRDEDEVILLGGQPRLYVPRQIGLLFRRVQDEIDAGDLADTPLRALMALMDDGEIEEAARVWGIRVVPGLRERAELNDRILAQVAEPGRIETVVSRLDRDAAVIWNWLRNQQNAAAGSVDEARIAAGIDPNDLRTTHRMQAALGHLEQALLVWHSWHPDDSRWLFIPAELRAPAPLKSSRLPTLEPLDPAEPGEPRTTHPHAVAWDLLTFLRAISAPDHRRSAETNRPWRKRLNLTLWNRGGEVPPPGYLPFLIALARTEELVTGGEGGHHAPLAITPAVRRWRERSFPDQTADLMGAWLGANAWVEGSAREDIDIWGADWRGFRRKLLAQLAKVPANTWFGLDDLANAIASRDTDLLGPTFTASTARANPQEGTSAGRHAALAETVAVTLASAGVWFGLVELAERPRTSPAIRLTQTGLTVAQAGQAVAVGVTGEPRLTVGPDQSVTLAHPAPLQIWSVLAFADVTALAEPSRYVLSETSIARALAAGFEARQIAAFLTGQSRKPLPPEVDAALQKWTDARPRVRIERTILLRGIDESALPTAETVVGKLGYRSERLGAALAIILPVDRDEDERDILRRVTRACQEAGLTVVTDQASASPPPPSRRAASGA